MTLHGLFVLCVVCVGVCVLMCLCASCAVVRAMSSGVCFYLLVVVYACCFGLHVFVCFVCDVLRDVVWCVVCVFVIVRVISSCVCVLRA